MTRRILELKVKLKLKLNITLVTFVATGCAFHHPMASPVCWSDDTHDSLKPKTENVFTVGGPFENFLAWPAFPHHPSCENVDVVRFQIVVLV